MLFSFLLVSAVGVTDSNERGVTMVDGILLRCIGHYTEVEQMLQNNLKTPVKWFQYGFRFLIGFPIRLLNWFGILSDSSFDSITSGGLFKFIAGCVALLGFISSIVTIITGWTAFKTIVMGLLHIK